MKIRLLAVGQKMPSWVTAGVEEYRRRLPAHIDLQIVEIPPGRRPRNADLERAIASERDALLKALAPQDLTVALDVGGKPWSTEQLARQLESWLGGGIDVALLVGGADGLHPDCLAAASTRWSLGPLTLPHPLVRVVVAEQLYRAWTIVSGHPYHRG